MIITEVMYYNLRLLFYLSEIFLCHLDSLPNICTNDGKATKIVSAAV